jgi:hypothetical protein
MTGSYIIMDILTGMLGYIMLALMYNAAWGKREWFEDPISS